MIFPQKPLRRYLTLTLLLTAFSVRDGFAQGHEPNERADDAGEATIRSRPAAGLAAQVHEIANSVALSRTKKEKRISTAVRIAVVAATAYQTDANTILGVALEIASTAASAAPSFTEVIVNAVSFAPAVANISSAPGQIRTAAFAAAKAPRNKRNQYITYAAKTKPVQAPMKPRADTAAVEALDNSTDATSAPTGRTTKREMAANDQPNDAMADYSGDLPPTPQAGSNIVSTTNRPAFALTAEAGIRHDDNVFLSNTAPVGDTIVTATPGVEMHYGQNSLAHGSLFAKDSFVRYTGHSTPNVNLVATGTDFGYDNGVTAVKADATFQQYNQNSGAVASLGQHEIFRYNTLTADGNVESELSAKVRAALGLDFLETKYQSQGLVGSKDTSIPLKFYYETTPKLSVSTGIDYRNVTPDNGGPRSKDLDYNIGFRGNFTAKLSGEISLNYRTRQVEEAPKESLWGFNGTLNYDLTAKSSLALVLSRDFDTGALGESLKTSSYALKFSTEISPQWQAGANATYTSTDFGPNLFDPSRPASVVQRKDGNWIGSFQVTYLFTNSFTATADYSLRKNQSTIPSVEFSNNIFSLMFGYRY